MAFVPLSNTVRLSWDSRISSSKIEPFSLNPGRDEFCPRILLGRQIKDVTVFLRELMVPSGSDSISPSFMVGNVTTKLFEHKVGVSCQLPPASVLHLNTVQEMLSQLEKWPHCNLVDTIQSVLRRT